MYAFLMVMHLLICLALVGLVLIQSGKGGGLAGGAFGGSAQTVFGGRGATDFITRATMVLGGAFFVTSLVLALLSSGTGRSSRSLMQEEARKAASTAPARLPSAGQPQGQTQGQPKGQPSLVPQPPAPAPAPAPAQSGATPAPAGKR